MLYQLFRKQVPVELLMSLLERICLKTEKYYLVDANAFKILLYNKYYEDFIESMREYYHLSKLYYLDREFTYKSFVNIVRQICKSNNILYSSKMKYERSDYNIDYFIFFP
jgi:hypothetical protein